MDTYEATKIVLSRIQNLDPANASKIMGYILIQDQGDKDMIRLAFGPETVLISLINQAKVRLGLSSNTSSATFKFTSFSSPRITIPNNGGGFQHHDDDGDGGGGGSHNDDEYCMYYARGFCKNGNSCKFVHGDYDAINSKIDYFEALKQQRFAAQFMASRGGHTHGHHPFSYNQRSAAAALMMSNEFHKYGQSLPDRNEFAAMALGGNLNSTSRQIYLTFPADSTFKEEDVSNYFSMYGPVQDVRIPYQQKRMFGFVTFVYPETVKLILAKANPHFVCDSRVLVKPYKEKGTILDKKQQQQVIDRGELSACLSPSGLESGELYDTPFGARMLYNSHEMMLRRRIAQDAELQQAIDLQGRRLMNFQLIDMKKQHHDNHFQPSLAPGVPSASQMQPWYQNSQGLVYSSNGISQEVLAETNGVQEPTEPPVNAADEKVPQEMRHTNNGNGSCSKEQTLNTHDSDLQKSLEHILPDNLFASPKKSAAEEHVAFSTASAEADISSPTTAATSSTNTDDTPMLPTTSTFNMASVKSCSFEMPRFVSGQEASET